MGRKSITGGVTPAGPARIQFDFYIDRVRFRPTVRWIPNEANLRRARMYLARIKARIAAGTFCFADEFPDYQHLQKIRVPLSARTCGEVFDAFLRHDEARLARGDLAASTVASYRQILNHDWRPYIGHLPFLGVPYSMLVRSRTPITATRKPTTTRSALCGERLTSATLTTRKGAIPPPR
jgi:integrase